ncbi:MAG TPA: hypothetical protein PKK26_10440 [Candidatus Wallbacteria bacterium]|nr:hypothetical protein [Candidatus Wallbacteria bacterium]
MKKRKMVLTLVLSAFLCFSAYPVSAQSQPSDDQRPSADSLKAAVPANETEKDFEPKVKDKDPFKTLVVPPPAVKDPEINIDRREKKDEPPPVQPLPLKVTFIVGTDIRRFAVISFNDKYYEMANGEEAESGLFKVIEIMDRGVKIWDSKILKERVIALNE